MKRFSWTKLGRMLRDHVGANPTRSDRVGIQIARLIVAGHVWLADTVFALVMPFERAPVAWPLPERRAILGAIAYANQQWLAGLTGDRFGIFESTLAFPPRSPQGPAFAEVAAGCRHRIELPLERRPANALNIEIGASLPRCRLRTPEHWGDADPRAARWLLSGGSALILGPCSRARCPQLAAMCTSRRTSR